MRTIGLVAVLVAFAIATTAAAQDIDTLYRATAIVTGKGEENRAAGFRLCMEDVIVRVSGDYRLVTSGEAAATVADAAKLVTEFRYRDRLEGIPIHDEQGSYARPHDLTVEFDHGKVDAALAAMGGRPWLAPRPRLVVFLGVRNATGTFMLSADGDQGFYMRDSFNAASDRIAIPIDLPTGVEIGAFKLDPETVLATDPDLLDALARRSGGDLALAGSLVWSDAALGWIATWRLRSGGDVHEWQVSGVSFDEAFRNALRGAAQVLSGNGQPQG